MKICGVNAPVAPPVAPPLQVAIKVGFSQKFKSAAVFFQLQPKLHRWEIWSKKPSLFVHQMEQFVPDFKARLAFVQCLWTLLRLPTTVAPQYNEGSRDDWQNLFAIKRFRYIEVLCHMFYYHWGKKKSFVIGRFGVA